jgi:chromosome segregation ATPase
VEPERRYIEEVGEAVEALGIMLEKELGGIKQALGALYQSLGGIKDQEKNLNGELQKLREEVKNIDGFLHGVENMMSRTESRLTDLQTGSSDEEDLGEEIKADLLVVKRELQFVRSDLKELLIHQETMAKKSQQEQAANQETQPGDPPAAEG